MTQDSPDVTAAKIEAERARARLMDTAQQLQSRLSPRTLAHNAWEGAKEKGADLAEDAVDAVRKRPLAATGVVAAIAMYLAREPLKDLAGKLVGSGGDSRQDEADEHSETQFRTRRQRDGQYRAELPDTGIDRTRAHAGSPAESGRGL